MPSTASMIIVWEVLNKGFIRYGSGALTAEQAGFLCKGWQSARLPMKGMNESPRFSRALFISVLLLVIIPTDPCRFDDRAFLFKLN